MSLVTLCVFFYYFHIRSHRGGVVGKIITLLPFSDFYGRIHLNFPRNMRGHMPHVIKMDLKVILGPIRSEHVTCNNFANMARRSFTGWLLSVGIWYPDVLAILSNPTSCDLKWPRLMTLADGDDLMTWMRPYKRLRPWHAIGIPM